ncbi:F-box/LRR-repeat protein At5g63520 isoform X2 [Jatropha curcas]|uniref:F-box/LRR-repeat protein At5g63520 isoform X2 n=1 Tax=Jatropha curcas TaxID=180498 RepID=UPI0009D6800D|nr:F-box/LRR-repeat protein At5g63520 isoform X2 [Jatropha curcas]
MKKKPTEEVKMGFGSLSEDIVEKILRRLPALSLASAACVSKSWYQNCNRILSRPKLSSALSLNPSLDIAMQEILDKVLSEPIRPHFAIANGFGNTCGMQKAFDFFAGRLGSRTPLIVTWANGIMGRDAITSEFEEVMGGDDDSDDNDEHTDANSGILLTVGFIPGLKVEAIPLLRPVKAPRVSMADDLVMDIRNYTASASDSTSPVGIIMFGDGDADLKPVIEKLDYAMSKETIIAGDENTKFLYRSGTESRNLCGSTKYFSDAITLVFARDREKPRGIGEIQFHAALSNGLRKIGPRYKAASVRVNGRAHTTWLTARREGQREILDGQMIVNEINDELEDRVGGTDLYIGVTKHRKCSVGTEKSRLISSLAFHGVMEADEEYLFVYGTGIRTADYFQFYHSDPCTALSSCNAVSANLRNLRLDWSCKKGLNPTDIVNECKKECIGGFIFSCCGRGESFLGRRNVDSSPFLENFPEAPVAGIFCGGEIGRGISILNAPEGQEESILSCSLHVFSTVFLLLTYAPAPLEHHMT